MFRQSSGDDHEEKSQGGTRYLFSLGHFECHDSMDGEGALHHFVVETGGAAADATVYEMERSPAHEALLDTLEIAAARARAGESEFSFDDLGVAEDWDELDENGEPVEDPGDDQGEQDDAAR